jgi:hypothetical protein
MVSKNCGHNHYRFERNNKKNKFIFAVVWTGRRRAYTAKKRA